MKLHLVPLRAIRRHGWMGLTRLSNGFCAGKWRAIAAFRGWIAIAVAFYIFVAYPRILNDWFDLNLELVRRVGDLPVIGQHLEAFLRFFNAERLLIFPEIGIPIFAIAWLARHTTARPRRLP